MALTLFRGLTGFAGLARSTGLTWFAGLTDAYSSPVPPGSIMITEASDTMITEDDNQMITE